MKLPQYILNSFGVMSRQTRGSSVTSRNCQRLYLGNRCSKLASHPLQTPEPITSEKQNMRVYGFGRSIVERPWYDVYGASAREILIVSDITKIASRSRLHNKVTSRGQWCSQGGGAQGARVPPSHVGGP